MTQIDQTTQVAVSQLTDEDQKKLVQKMIRRFRKAESAVGTMHQQWKMLDLFDRGKQWETVSLPVWLPKPVTNLIRMIRTTKRANLALNVPRAELTPMTPLDAPLVEHLQKAYEHVWDEEKATLLVRRCVDRALLHGTSIAYVYVDEEVKGKYYGENHSGNMLYKYNVKMKRINNANFFPDPDAYSKNQCKFIEVTENIAFSSVKNDPTYKQYAGKRLENLKFSDLQRESDATGDIYIRDNNMTSNGNQRDTGDDMCTVHHHFERFKNSEGKWQVDVSYYLWNTDFLLYKEEDIPVNEYPFAILYDEEEDMDFWGTSTAMDMLENQKIINKTAQTASIIGTLHQNPQKVVLRDSGINASEMSRTGTLPGKVWTSNVPNAVEKIEPPDIPKGLFEIEDRMKADIKDMAGLSEAYMGQSVGSLTTSTGVDSLIERATVRDKDKSVQIDDFVEDLSMLIIKFIICYWKEPRPIMTRQLNGQAQYDTWTPLPDMVVDNLEWRLRSNVYAKAPMTQAAKRQQADKLMQMQGQFQFNPPIITPEEWIVLQDFDNKEDVLARMQQDRVKMQSQESQTMSQNIMGIVQQAKMLKGKGMTDDQITQQIQPMINQLVQTTNSTGVSQVLDIGGGMGTPASPQGQRQGVMNETAGANMTQGS
jgi:hypothetical protein